MIDSITYTQYSLALSLLIVAYTFLIDALIRAIGFAISGFYTSTALINILYALPVMFIAMYIGEHFHTNITQRSFQKAIGVFLIFSGIALILKN